LPNIYSLDWYTGSGGLDVVAVVPLGSTLDGIKMNNMQAMMQGLIRTLTPVDRLCIVTSGDGFEQRTKLDYMTVGHQKVLYDFVGAIRPRDSRTNIVAAVSLAHVALRAPPGDVRASIILLFSDGFQGSSVPTVKRYFSTVPVYPIALAVAGQIDDNVCIHIALLYLVS
jgi:hypothetical protein